MPHNLKQFFSHDYTKVYVVLLIGAVLGLVASFTLSTEALELAKNANTVLPCDLNGALSCGAVGRHPSASVFGFPNAFLGVIGFSVMVTIAVAGLMETKFPKLFMYFAWAGILIGLIFAIWMFSVSYFVIEVLCPWCLTTDLATLLILWALTRYNISEHNLYLSRRHEQRANAIIAKNFDTVAVIILAVIALLMIFTKFGSQLFA